MAFPTFDDAGALVCCVIQQLFDFFDRIARDHWADVDSGLLTAPHFQILDRSGEFLDEFLMDAFLYINADWRRHKSDRHCDTWK